MLNFHPQLLHPGVVLLFLFFTFILGPLVEILVKRDLLLKFLNFELLLDGPDGVERLHVLQKERNSLDNFVYMALDLSLIVPLVMNRL